MIYFIIDDFGNQWRIRITEDNIRIMYPAPFKSLEDDLHNIWGGWK